MGGQERRHNIWVSPKNTSIGFSAGKREKSSSFRSSRTPIRNTTQTKVNGDVSPQENASRTAPAATIGAADPNPPPRIGESLRPTAPPWRSGDANTAEHRLRKAAAAIRHAGTPAGPPSRPRDKKSGSGPQATTAGYPERGSLSAGSERRSRAWWRRCRSAAGGRCAPWRSRRLPSSWRSSRACGRWRT